MTVPQTVLLVVALVISAAVPRTSADAVTSLGSAALTATLALSAVPLNSLSITQAAASLSSDCSITVTVQPTDTVNSVIAVYGLNTSAILASYNPGLDVTQPLGPGTSLCVGVGPALCNTALVGGVCPATTAPLVDYSTSSLKLPRSINKALTLQPDLGTILQDPKTTASLFYWAGTPSLVLVVPSGSKAAKQVSTNSGHPWINLWVASGSTQPLIITVRPSWFTDGSDFYTYVPGSAVKTLAANPVVQQAQSLLSSIGLKRNLLSVATSRKLLQGADPPGGGGKGSGCGSWCYGR